jgi:dUTP pyrophosphatase
MKLKVKYLDENLTKMNKIEKGDLVDLRASRIFVNGEERTLPCEYKFGDTVFVKLGFAMEMPKGKKANVFPRSGTFKNYGLLLTNSVGQIDNSYNGDKDEWCAMFWSTRDGVMNYNDRILQFEVVDSAMNDAEFEFVDKLGDIDRGGYSSTGVK